MSIDCQTEIDAFEDLLEIQNRSVRIVESPNFQDLSLPGIKMSDYKNLRHANALRTRQILQLIPMIKNIVDELINQHHSNTDMELYPSGADEVRYFKFDNYQNKIILIANYKGVIQDLFENPESLKELLKKEFNNFFEI